MGGFGIGSQAFGSCPNPTQPLALRPRPFVLVGAHLAAHARVDRRFANLTVTAWRRVVVPPAIAGLNGWTTLAGTAARNVWCAS
jgi:hypothetical protein